ncbi:MAG: CheR family methyltransferase, partial [Myxococcota bacterium]
DAMIWHLKQDAKTPNAGVPQALLQEITALLGQDEQVDFSHYRESVLHRRIERRRLLRGMANYESYLELLREFSEERDALRRDLLVCVTDFFRDPEAWSELSKAELPRLIEEADPEQGLRVWVTACATGEEAYTVGMLILEQLDQLDIRMPVKIFATDANPDVIVQAANGVYSEENVRALSQTRRERFLTRQSQQWLVRPELRRLVTFAQHDLTRHAPFTRMDLVTCRNVLIYMQPSLQAQVLRLLNFSLRLNGILMLGRAETTSDVFPAMERVSMIGNLYRKVRDAKRFTSDRPMPMLTPVLYHQKADPPRPDPKASLGSVLRIIARGENSLFLVLTEDGEVLQMFGNGEDIIQRPEGEVGVHLPQLFAPSLALLLQSGLERVRSSNEPIIFPRVQYSEQDDSLELELSLYSGLYRDNRMYIARLKRQEDLDVDNLDIRPDLDEVATQRIISLEQEIRSLRVNLRTSNEELRALSEEQQATNEELVAANEELQGTNEELQAVNEELHTLNAEYQARLEELKALNDDIDNLLQEVYIGTLFLDTSLRIRRFTNRIPELINLMRHDLGRLITHFTHRFREPIDIGALALTTMETGEPQRLEVNINELEQRTLLMSVNPYLQKGRDMNGAVITFIDITEQTRQRTYIELGLEPHDIGRWRWDYVTDTIWFDKTMRSLFGLPDESPTNAEVLGETIPLFAEDGLTGLDQSKDIQQIQLPSDSDTPPLRLRFRIRKDQNGTIVGLIGVGWRIK